MDKTQHIALVDDERNIRLSIESAFVDELITIHSFAEPVEAIKSLVRNSYDLIILDIRIGNHNGLDVYREIKSLGFSIPVIFISGAATLSEAAESLKLGAYDFLEKPFTREKLLITVKNCFAYYDLQTRFDKLSETASASILGEHELISQLKLNIEKTALTNATVLISGESGTGKELISESIHQRSKRASHEFVKVNCSAIPINLIESALFGHVKGAFTGAESDKKGFFELANKGTIFLDEIGDMPFSAQASLLRVLEEGEIQKVGSEQIKKIDVRVIAASHKDLLALVEQSKFREDLFYRLNVIPLVSPSLRERSSDISLLFDTFVERSCKKHGIPIKPIDEACFPTLKAYSWPGNVRELVNIAERMVILSGRTIGPEDIPPEILPNAGEKLQSNKVNDNLNWREYRNQADREFLIQRLNDNNGNIAKTARELELDRSYLYRKLASLQIEVTPGKSR